MIKVSKRKKNDLVGATFWNQFDSPTAKHVLRIADASKKVMRG